MIQASEVRIGNLLLSGGVVVTVDARSIFDIWDVSKKYDPIPITPEWLERLGAESEAAQHYVIKVDQKTIIVVWADPLEVEVCHYYSEVTTLCKHIKHIHQLQNLYCALTGEELTTRSR